MKEIRLTQINEFRAFEENDEMILEGYAAVFDKPTVIFRDVDGTEYFEVLARNAFDGADLKKCCLKYNHEDCVPILARVRGGSLELKVDDYGLFFRGKLFNTQTSRDIYQIVKSGGIDECSFAFTIKEDGYDRETRTRTIRKIDTLYDVSVVDHPAYEEGTSVSARSFLEAEAEKDRLDNLRREQEERERKLKLLKLRLEVNS